MSQARPDAKWRVGALLRSPLAWIALVLVLALLATAAVVGKELYASTSLPMVLNPR